MLGGYFTDNNNLLPEEVRFDMLSQTFSNLTTENGLNLTRGRGSGAMQFVPAFGPEGIFVTMGGEDSPGEDGPGDLLGFDSVLILDQSTQTWYNQTTTGSPPSPRTGFCTAGISSNNNTYEMYETQSIKELVLCTDIVARFVYAGDQRHLGSPAIPFDSVNILTIPAFHWFSVPYNPQNPRSGHTCNPVGGSQVLIVGGIDSNAPISYGDYETIEHSTFSTPDPFKQGLEILDLQMWAFSGQLCRGTAIAV